MTELVAYINASVTDWNAGLICNGSATSADLVVTGAVSAKGTANKQTLLIVDNYLLTELINRASDLINRYCGRILKTTTYSDESYYGSGSCRLFLDQYPVSVVSRLASGRSNSFSITNTSTDADYCTVEVTASKMRLVVSGGTNADDSELTLATYTSIDLLLAAITALGKGWSMTTLATDTSYRGASELLSRPSMYVDTVTSAYIETPDAFYTEYKLISPETGRNYGAIEKPGAFLTGTEYFVTYTAGYTTIPYSLEMACLELIKYKYDQKDKDSGLKSEKIGNVYAYENFSLADIKNGLTEELKGELDLFRRRDFVCC